MTINIPRNDYVQPTEVRQEVVQGICEAFLNRCAWSVFHPFSDGCYRQRTKFIMRHKGAEKFHGFSSSRDHGDETVEFNGAEMQAAFKALQAAGYYMYKVYEYGSWMGYIVFNKPTYNGMFRDGTLVTKFTDFID